MQRDLKLDIMRFFGLSLIILAHTQPPEVIYQLRTFDVPLMIFISGLAYSSKSIDSYWTFVKKRLLRLCVPVWLFLTFYFAFVFILSKFGVDKMIDARVILSSYALLQGIGFVWIIRIFLLIMLVTPFLLKINKKTSFIGLLFVMFSLVIAQQFFIQSVNYFAFNSFINLIYKYFFLYLVGFVPLFILGLCVKKMTLKKNCILLLLLSVIFILSSLYLSNEDLAFDMQRFKHPPSFYYVMYGMFGCVAVYICQPVWNKLSKIRVFTFVGQNTIWIYLWHILGLKILSYFDFEWYVLFLILYPLSVFLFFIQYKIVNRFVKNKRIYNYFIG